MNKEVEEAIKKATREAIREFDKEKQLEKRGKVFQNTRLLMRHYNDLKDHTNKGIDSLRFAIEDKDYDKLTEDEIFIISIKRSKAKTLVMIAHIDMALDELKKRQIKEDAIEKYFALEMYFIKDMSYEEIQEKLNCGKNTPSRWVNQMIDRLSVLLFGIDGVKIDMVG
ncbi:MAG: hypothetical protein RSA29_02680 [Clostridium sp.]|uniref:hypothetical protein n=1 Tax=Clostridium sp. TaxID=1506 RepID=UPI00303BE3EA